MLTYLVAFALAFGVSAVLTPLLRILAPAIGGLDRAASSRKVHRTPIPRIGGVAIVIGFFVPLVGLFVYTNDVSALFLSDKARVAGLFVGGTAIAALGFYDDLHGAGARLKFFVQFAVALLMFKLGFRIENIANPFGTMPFSLTHVPIPGTDLLVNVSLPFTMLWIAGIINAMNLIDGLDGLAGGVALISIGLTFAVAFNRPEVLMCLFMAALGGAVMGFLLYNFNPATIFMGDTGSMFLGFVLATTSIVSNQKSSAVAAMLVPIIGLGLPIADTLLAMLRRALRGRPLFSADKEHIHHKLLAMGFTHRQAVLTLYGFCIVLAVIAFGVAYGNSRDVALLLGSLGLVSVVVLRWLGYLRLDPERSRQNAQSRERNQKLRSLVREIGEQLREADSVESIWNALKFMGPALNASEMTLSLVVSQDSDEEIQTVLSWRSQSTGQIPQGLCSAGMTLRGNVAGREPHPLGALTVYWNDGRREVDRDDEIALEMLVDGLETAVVRVSLVPEAEPVLAPAEPMGEVVRLRRSNDR
jgi:UDP-GlcNAc:undecaprenyl-phosphate GlcNAc-1-phosphate transferase